MPTAADLTINWAEMSAQKIERLVNACNDDADPFFGTDSAVVVPLTIGQSITIRVSGAGWSQGPFDIFILPPPPVLQVLERRLRGRGQDPEEAIQRRLRDAREEISHVAEFDYVIINKEFEEARRDLTAVVRAARLNLSRQSARYPEIFKSIG